MSKPYVIVHTHISVDGKIHAVDIPAFDTASRQYSAPYRDFLRRVGISYLIAGQETLDQALALEKLNSVFGMQRVMIGGADGDTTQPGLFSAVPPLSAPQARSFTLIEVRELRDSVLLVRYRVDPATG